MSTDLADALVIWANGWLAAAYWTWNSAALLLTIGIAIFITVRYDREVRRTAGERVRRYGRGEIIIASRRSLYETLMVLAVWSLAASVTAPPIPFIGLLMWLAFLIALRLIPQEREQILFRQKVMIGIYARRRGVGSIQQVGAAGPDRLAPPPRHDRQGENRRRSRPQRGAAQHALPAAESLHGNAPTPLAASLP